MEEEKRKWLARGEEINNRAEGSCGARNQMANFGKRFCSSPSQKLSRFTGKNGLQKNLKAREADLAGERKPRNCLRTGSRLIALESLWQRENGIATGEVYC